MAGELLVEVGIALTALALGGALAVRADQSVIPMYIVAGIVVGPNEPTSIGPIPLTLVSNHEFVDVLAELGVVFLLFFLGLEFNLERFVTGWDRLVGIGAVDFAANFGLGAALGFAFGFGPIETLFVAGIVYVSSSAVVTKSLIERGWIANPESEAILGTLVFEDILVAVYLALLSALVLGGGLDDAATSVGVAFAFLGALVLLAWYGTDYVDRAFAVDSDELFLLSVLGVTTLVAGAALTAGVSEAVAAFFVGTAFSATDHAHRIETVVAPARDLFAAFFFFAIGLSTDVTVIAGVADLLVAAVVLTLVVQLASGFVGGRIYGLDRRRSLRVGVGLVPRGEFSLVIAALATSVGTGALAEVVPAFAVGYVLAMSILGSLLMGYADSLTAYKGGFSLEE
ncbi:MULTISPECIES: cation:proton antiporter [Halorussus]|uniref:cation:proton antiporter n=1 Tax=Halorussus TaxID=1070314 RepID=UPI0020A07D7B|nr:cation:proton antiporter [Halorussus vallis]USZ78164.1 cation:proton antiporter [Halorussus vallis]